MNLREVTDNDVVKFLSTAVCIDEVQVLLAALTQRSHGSAFKQTLGWIHLEKLVRTIK